MPRHASGHRVNGELHLDPGFFQTDVLITVNIAPHPYFKVDGNDLRLEHELALYDVAAGMRKLRELGFAKIAMIGVIGTPGPKASSVASVPRTASPRPPPPCPRTAPSVGTYARSERPRSF